jgi:hypothetical protein
MVSQPTTLPCASRSKCASAALFTLRAQNKSINLEYTLVVVVVVVVVAAAAGVK